MILVDEGKRNEGWCARIWNLLKGIPSLKGEPSSLLSKAVILPTPPIIPLVLSVLGYKPELITKGVVEPLIQLAIKSVHSTRGPVLEGLQIEFECLPFNEGALEGSPTTYWLYLGYVEAQGPFKPSTVTLWALVDEQWVHQPLLNPGLVLDRLRAVAMAYPLE